jgi:hypothetical protein
LTGTEFKPELLFKVMLDYMVDNVVSTLTIEIICLY